jgi:hypothetical protein
MDIRWPVFFLLQGQQAEQKIGRWLDAEEKCGAQREMWILSST